MDGSVLAQMDSFIRTAMLLTIGATALMLTRLSALGSHTRNIGNIVARTGIYQYNEVEFGPEGAEETAEAPAPELVASSETATVQA